MGHHAIAMYVEAEALAVLVADSELRATVVINEENVLTVVAALNNVVRLPWQATRILSRLWGAMTKSCG